MDKIICFGLVLCASLALTTAYPEPAPEAPLAPGLGLKETPTVEVVEELQPEESRWGHGGWGYGGGYGRGHGWGHGGYGHGGYGHGGYGHGGYGHGGHGHGGWGRGGWGR